MMAKSNNNSEVKIPELEEIPGRKPMAQVKVVESHVLEFENIVFDLEEIQNLVSEWFGNHKYITPEKKKVQKVTPLGIEFEIKNKAIKAVDRFSQYVIKLVIKVERGEDIKIKGTNKMLTGGVIVFSLDSYIELDYEHDWDKSKFQKFLGYLYLNYIYKPTLIKHVLRLRSESNSLYSIVKTAAKRYS